MLAGFRVFITEPNHHPKATNVPCSLDLFSHYSYHNTMIGQIIGQAPGSFAIHHLPENISTGRTTKYSK